MSGVITLTRAITAHGEQLTELTLREPTTEDVMEVGHPFLIHATDSGDAKIEIRSKVIATYVSRLAGVPLSSVKTMALSDFSTAQAVVMGFFGKGDSAPAQS